MIDETEVEVEVVDAEPIPEVVAGLEESMPSAEELAVRGDTGDMHNVVLAMDANDVKLLLDRIQGSGEAIRKWVYDADGKNGLSIHGVQDIVQSMNWTRKCKIRVDPSTKEVERFEEATGQDGAMEPYWSITIAAIDEVTGMTLMGESTEPVYMKLRDGSRKFDVFAKTKALQKAQRNALAGFIPEIVEQTVIGIYARDPSRVQPIVTEAEVKAEALPQPLTTPEGKELIARCDALYDQIKAIGPEARTQWGVSPGRYDALMRNAHHDVDALHRFIGWLEEQLEVLPGAIRTKRQQTRAVETVKDAACPKCGAQASKSCMQVDDAGAKVLRGDKPVWLNQPHKERLTARFEAIVAEEA